MGFFSVKYGNISQLQWGLSASPGATPRSPLFAVAWCRGMIRVGTDDPANFNDALVLVSPG